MHGQTRNVTVATDRKNKSPFGAATPTARPGARWSAAPHSLDTHRRLGGEHSEGSYGRKVSGWAGLEGWGAERAALRPESLPPEPPELGYGHDEGASAPGAWPPSPAQSPCRAPPSRRVLPHWWANHP